MNKDEIYWDYIKIGVVILSILSPFLYMVIAQELLPSLSSYWRTPAQPLFVITNASVSYFLFNVKGWRASSVLLLLLTAFSIDYFPITHNVLAVFFFLCNLYPMLTIKRGRNYIFPYLGIVFFVVFGILWYEIAAILVISFYHGSILLTKIKIERERSSEIGNQD